MVIHRSLLLAALLASACSSTPTRMETSAWRDRVKTLQSEPMEAAAEVELPSTLTGPLLAKSFLMYELRHGENVWDIRFQGPERNVQRVDSWASVTLTSPGNQRSAMIKAARVYSGRVNITPRGEKAEDELLLLALAFSDRALFDACEVLGPMSPEEFAASSKVQETADAYVGAFLSGFSAAFTVRRSEEIASLLASFMQWPSGLFGVDREAAVAFQPDVLAAVRCSTPFGPGWRIPMEVQVDGEQGFVGTVTVVEPGGALNLSAGVVEVSGFAPNRPDETVRLRLTGAHAPRTDHLAESTIDNLLVIKPRSKSEITALQ